MSNSDKKIRISSGDDLKHTFQGATMGMKVGYQGRLEDKLDKYFSQTENFKKGKEYVEAHISEWIKAGEEMVYPEKLDSWKKSIENSRQDPMYGLDIQRAIEVMRTLDTDTEIKDVVERFKGNTHFGTNILKLIISFSKRGPEYIEQFMNESGRKITPEFAEMLEKIKGENKQYAQNELARNRADKASKTDELAQTSSKLNELSAQNQTKDENHIVQE